MLSVFAVELWFRSKASEKAFEMRERQSHIHRAVRSSLKLVFCETLSVCPKARSIFVFAKMPAKKLTKCANGEANLQPRSPTGGPSRGGNRRCSRALRRQSPCLGHVD